jgi:hypothetical protein
MERFKFIRGQALRFSQACKFTDCGLLGSDTLQSCKCTYMDDSEEYATSIFRVKIWSAVLSPSFFLSLLQFIP